MFRPVEHIKVLPTPNDARSRAYGSSGYSLGQVPSGRVVDVPALLARRTTRHPAREKIMRKSVASLISASAAAAAVVAIFPVSPALASSPASLISCKPECSLTMGTTDAHVLHVWTSDMPYIYRLTVRDNQTQVYVYNNTMNSATGNVDTWVGGLYGSSYTARVQAVCSVSFPCFPNKAQRLHLANY